MKIRQFDTDEHDGQYDKQFPVDFSDEKTSV